MVADVCICNDVYVILRMLVTITSANLIGRSEDTTEGLTVNQLNRVVTHLLVVINTQRKSGQLTHLYELVTAVREITVSGRHLKMMVEAGILKAFAIVAGEDFKKILAFFGTAITAGKTMEVHAWEMVAFVGLHTALSENGEMTRFFSLLVFFLGGFYCCNCPMTSLHSENPMPRTHARQRKTSLASRPGSRRGAENVGCN